MPYLQYHIFENQPLLFYTRDFITFTIATFSVIRVLRIVVFVYYTGGGLRLQQEPVFLPGKRGGGASKLQFFKNGIYFLHNRREEICDASGYLHHRIGG